MRYRDINWNVEINGEQAECDDTALDIIAQNLQNGYSYGTFTYDVTDYAICEDLKTELENKLGRTVDYSVDNDDVGELNELYAIALKNQDTEIIELLNEIFKYGFTNYD